MSKISRAIAGGVGLGLQQFGQGMLAQHQQEQKNARVDARLEKTDAFAERDLVIREQEAATRKAAAERQTKFDGLKLSHANLLRVLADPDANIPMQLKGVSDFFPDGRTYSLNPDKDAYTREDGKQPWLVMNRTSPVKDPATGQLMPDEQTGEAKQEAMPLGPRVFWTKDEFTNWKMQISNAAGFSALYMQGQSAEQARETEIKFRDATGQTERDEAKLANTQAGTKLKGAQTEKVEKETELLGREGGGGKLAKIKQQGLNQFANNLKSEFGTAFSEGQAKLVQNLYDDKDTRDKFREVIAAAVDPENTKITKQDFIESGVSRGLPKEFLTETYRKAEASFNEREEATQFGSNRWMSGFMNGLLSFLD